MKDALRIWLAVLPLVMASEGGAAEPAPHLYELPGGELARVRYAAGALERASQLRQTFELLARQGAGWSGRRQTLTVQLLDRRQWEAAGHAMPYGVPVRAASLTLAMPAWGDDGTVELWRRRLGGELPASPAAPLRSSDEEAASLVASDLLALVEGGRLLLEEARLRAAEAWIGELLVHSAAAGVLARGGRPELEGAASLYRRIARVRVGGALPLAAFRAGIGFDDWLWFQARFFDGAQRLVDAAGRGAAKALAQRAGPDGVLTRSELLERRPELQEWLAESFAPAPAD